METTSQRKYFKGLRALALTALFCTIALTLFIWGEALTPGDKSAIQSVKVSDNIQSAMKSDEPAPPVSAVTGFEVTKNVKWEVVKGEGSIDENGVFTSDKSGKVTVRATYVDRPDLTVEKTITVSVFDTFHTLIRKGLGHFSLFLVLGFGLFGTFFLLIKPRWASLPLSLLSAFVVAGISEMFQLPVFTSGRYATWPDVAIDFLGALSGIGIAVAAVSIVGLIWFKAKPESFKNMKNEFSFLTFKTSFKKQENIFTDEN